MRDRADHDLSHLVDILEIRDLGLGVEAVADEGVAVLTGELAEVHSDLKVLELARRVDHRHLSVDH